MLRVIGAALLMAIWAMPAIRSRSKKWVMPELPIGALVCAGGVVSCLWGPQILATYQRWSSLAKLAFKLP